MFTLFQVVTGDSWSSVVVRGVGDSVSMKMMFMIYYAFAAFGLLNVITGVFVEQTLYVAKNDEENILDEITSKKLASLEFLHELFDTADSDRSGTITKEEFKEVMEKPAMQEALQIM